MIVDGTLALGVAMTAAAAAAFLSIGFANDVARWRADRRRSQIYDDLATVVFRSDVDAADAAERLARYPRSLVLSLAQRLAADLDGEAALRLRRLAAMAGLDRPIRRALRSRSWRRRAQGAGLVSLLPQDDPVRARLLRDPHPLVRARAAEAMTGDDIGPHAARLVELLDDDVEAVKFAAQSALLHGGGRIVADLQTYLETADDNGVGWALEVAANTPDARLVPGIRRHLESDDPARRAIATRAIAPWLDDTAELRARLHDEDPGVRATAAAAAGYIGAQALAAEVGRLLGDRSWNVREQAGRALVSMGPAGVMTLRIHLRDEDPYAQDMARQMLDTVAATSETGVPA